MSNDSDQVNKSFHNSWLARLLRGEDQLTPSSEQASLQNEPQLSYSEWGLILDDGTISWHMTAYRNGNRFCGQAIYKPRTPEFDVLANKYGLKKPGDSFSHDEWPEDRKSKVG